MIQSAAMKTFFSPSISLAVRFSYCSVVFSRPVIKKYLSHQLLYSTVKQLETQVELLNTLFPSLLHYILQIFWFLLRKVWVCVIWCHIRQSLRIPSRAFLFFYIGCLEREDKNLWSKRTQDICHKLGCETVGVENNSE